MGRGGQVPLQTAGVQLEMDKGLSKLMGVYYSTKFLYFCYENSLFPHLQ